MTAPGYTMKQERNTLFCAAEKGRFYSGLLVKMAASNLS